MGSQVDDFLHQQMDRKQFLKNVGAGLAAVVGLGMVARAFQQHAGQQGLQQSSSAMGYGSSTYGGAPKQVVPQSTPFSGKSS